MRTFRIPRRAAIAAAVVALVAGGGAAVAAVNSNGSACTPPNDKSSIAQLRAWEECRFNALEGKVDALAPVTVTAPPVTVTVTPTTTTTSATTPPTTTSTTTTVTTPPTTTTTTTGSGKGQLVLGRYFPDKTTTGVPAGTVLTPYTGSCSLSDPNAAPVTISNKTITCDQFRILQPGVTIKNSIINGTVYSDCCYLNGSFTIIDSEVRGPNSPDTVVGEARFTLLRVEITGGSRSVNCNDTCDVRDSYIHGQYKDLRGIDHESGVRQDGHGTFVHNTIACDAVAVPNPNGGEGSGCSAAVTGYGDFGTVNNNTFDNNLISSGQSDNGQPASSYCIYGGSTPGKPYPNANNIRFTNNILMRGSNGMCGIYGPVTSFNVNAPGNVWTNNVFDNGVTIPPTM